MLTHALRYAQQGWQVLPLHTTAGRVCSCARGAACPSPGKHPRTADGVRSSSSDAAQIRDWWHTWPDAWIGIATGDASGVWVLDVDTGAPPDGLTGTAALQELEAQHGLLPGLRARTGGSGLHLFYRMPADRPVRNRQRMRLVDGGPQTGLDVRGTGGYVVAAPSGHHSGNHYAWLPDSELVDAPAWLLDMVAPVETLPAAPQVQVDATDREQRYAQRVLDTAVQTIMQAGKGNRHAELNRQAYGVGGFAWLLGGIDACVQPLVEAFLHACGDSKRAKEGTQTALDGLRAGAAKPRSVPNREQFSDSAPDSSWQESVDLPDDEQGLPVVGWETGPPQRQPARQDDASDMPDDDGAPSAPLDELDELEAPAPQRQRRPAIRVNGRQMLDVLADAWSAIRRLPAARAVYQQDGRCVRVLSSETGPRIDPLSSGAMTAALLQAAEWYRQRPAKRGEQTGASGMVDVPADRLPSHIVPSMLEAPPASLPVLERIARAPFVAADGSIVHAVGYHQQARTYLAEHQPVPRMTIDEACELLRDWLADFPFARPHDLAHAVGFLVTPLVRLLVRGPCPLTVFDAPVPGTGKSLLMTSLARVSAAHAVNPAALASNDEERRKSLVAHLSTGAPVVLLDNVTGRLDDDTLAGILTAWPRYADRRMGGQSLVQVPASAVWALSSNNAQMSADIARRSIVVRLDARCERPEQRQGFRHPRLARYTHENAARLRGAALALVEHWVALGCPDGPRKLGSYESWSRVVGGIVNEAGFSGWLEGREARLRAANPEVEEWRTLVERWLQQRPQQALRASEVAELAHDAELLLHVLGDGSKTSQARRMASALRRQIGRRLHVNGADREIVQDTSKRANAATWRIVGGDVVPLDRTADTPF